MKYPLQAVVAAACALTTLTINPAFAANTKEEAANKKLVLDYYREIDETVAAGKMMELGKVDAKYRDPGYIQHSVNSPGGSGMGGGGGMPQGMQMPSGGMPQGGPAGGMPQGMQMPPGGMTQGGPPGGGMPQGMQMPSGGMPKMEPATVLAIMAEGDKVIQVTTRGKNQIIYNMFRVKNGKLIEHWDAFGTMPLNPTTEAPAKN